jgi:glycosyltransferase involved in cell wall biosynthesis
MVDLANGFVERGLNVDMVVNNPEGVYFSALSPQVRQVHLGVKRTAMAIPKLVQYLRSKQPKVLLSTLEHANAASLMANFLAGGKSRVVVREANTTSRGQKNNPHPTAKMVYLLLRWLYIKASGIVAVSEGVAQDLIQAYNIPASKVSVILNPVLTQRMFDLAQAPCPHPWLQQKDIPVILGVGRLSAQKDYPTLIKAFAKVRAQRPVRLIILGEGEDRKALEVLIHELKLNDDVSLPGFADNPFCYMAKASVFVLSSIFEGLPNALIQAMALGTPAVATDCPSGPHEILEGGRYGALIPMQNDQEMANAIQKTLDHPLPPVDQSWRQRYEVDQIISTYLGVLGFTGSDYSKTLS